MKRKVTALVVLLVFLASLTLGLTAAAWMQETYTGQPATAALPPDAEPPSTAGGMPGWPVPAQPIPHHEPGQPARSGNASHQVTQVNALGEEEVVELHGLDALLADGTITDPLQGNYELVSLDKVMFSAYDFAPEPNDFSVQSFGFVTPTLDLIPGSRVDLGNLRFAVIAAADLNGDYVDEQIVAWADRTDRHIKMSIGELPGSFGKTTSAPGVIAHPDGSLDVLVRGYDQALWHLQYDGATWGNWSNAAGGLLLSGPAVASRFPGGLDVFAVDAYNQVYHTQWISPTWTGWVKVNSGDIFPELEANVLLPQVPAPAVAARGGSQLDLFRLGPDNTLWWCHSADGDAWGAWQNLGGILASGPGAVSLGGDRMQVYALGMDGALWYRTCDSGDAGWKDWERLETPDGVAGNPVPALASPPTGGVTVYLAGSENRIWSINHDGTSWVSDWTSIDGPHVAEIELGPGIAAAGAHLIAQMSDGSLQYSSDASGWDRLEGLDVSQTFDTGAVTKPLPAEGELENPILDITTGYFTGDGRQQVVLAYDDTDDNLRVEIYDMQDCFRLKKTIEISRPISGSWPRVAAGNVDGEGVDEIGFVYVPGPDPTLGRVEMRVFQIEEAPSGNYLSQLGDSMPFEVNNYRFGGTLRIAAGDIVPDTVGLGHAPNDEFAVVCDWYHVDKVHSPWRFQQIARLYLYDYPKSLQRRKESFYEATDIVHELENDHATGVGLAVGDVIPSTSGYGIDEIVLLWPHLPDHATNPFWNNRFPQLIRDLLVYSVPEDEELFDEDGLLGDPDKQYSLHWSVYSYLDTVAVGDLDRDLRDEIVVAYEAGPDYWHPKREFSLQVYDCETLQGCVGYRVIYNSASDLRALNLAMGDFTGESLRVGPPTYRLQRDVGNLTAVVNAPPTHWDVIRQTDGTYKVLDVNSQDPEHATYSSYENETGTQTESSITVNREWGVSAGIEAKYGNVKTSLTTTYGEKFSNSDWTGRTLKVTTGRKLFGDDLIMYTGVDYDVYEYPLYEIEGTVPVNWVTVVWPHEQDAGIRKHQALASDADLGWRSNFQMHNVWSYPANENQFGDWSGTLDTVADIEEISVGNAASEGSVNWSDQTKTESTKESHLGVSASLEAKYGFCLIPLSVKVTLKGDYSQSELSTQSNTWSESTCLAVHYGPISRDSNYSVHPYLYWSDQGYLVLNYTTTPSLGATTWSYYNNPDPGFLLPNAWGIWGSEGLDFASEIVIDPPYASNGETVAITATVRNFSSKAMTTTLEVAFYVGDPDEGGTYIGTSTQITNLNRQTGPQPATMTWVANGSGDRRIYAVIDPQDKLKNEVHDEKDDMFYKEDLEREVLLNNNKGYGKISLGRAEYVDPGVAQEQEYQALSYTDSAGVQITAYIPRENSDAVIRYEMTSAAPQTVGASLRAQGSQLVGDAFTLSAYEHGADDPSPVSLKPVGKPPAVISVHYEDEDIAGCDEAKLSLYRKDGSGIWVPATCTGYTIQRFPEDNLIAVPICKTGTFVLTDTPPISSLNSLYLPLIMK